MMIDLGGATALHGTTDPSRTLKTENPFAGGLLAVLIAPITASLEECLSVLQARGVQVWTEQLPAPAEEIVWVAAMVCDEAPSMDTITDAEVHVLAVLSSCGIEVEVRGSGYLSAETPHLGGTLSPV